MSSNDDKSSNSAHAQKDSDSSAPGTHESFPSPAAGFNLSAPSSAGVGRSGSERERRGGTQAPPNSRTSDVDSQASTAVTSASSFGYQGSYELPPAAPGTRRDPYPDDTPSAGATPYPSSLNTSQDPSRDASHDNLASLAGKDGEKNGDMK
ncbi:hypothetical protein OQA88_11960 [Cercophora sp. LCS_1]